MKIQKNNIKETLKSIMREESDYQKFFRKSLKATGKSIPDMTDSEKKEFFNKIDNAWQAKGEKKENESFRGKFGVSEAKATPHLTDSEQQKIAKAIEKATGVSTDYEITDTRYNTGASDFGLDGGQESLLFVGKDDDGFNISVEVDGRQLGSEQAKNFNGAMKSAMKLAKKFKKQLTTETFSNKNESATKAIDLLLKNKGMKDAIKNDKVKVIRKALEDEGFNTKGISDKDILTLAKNLQNESINEATDKKTLELIHTGLGKPKSMPNPVNIYRKWESIKKKHKLNDDALGDYFNTYFKKEYDMARKFYMSNESVVNEAFGNDAAMEKLYNTFAKSMNKFKTAKDFVNTVSKFDKSNFGNSIGKTALASLYNKYQKLEPSKRNSMSSTDFKKWVNSNKDEYYKISESVVNESLKFNLIDPKTNRVLKNMSLDRPNREAEKIEQKLNKKLSSTAKSRGYYWTTASIGESVVNEASKADTIRKSMPGYVGPKFAKKASDEDILAMADLKDEKAKIHNRYMKSIDDKIKKLQKKYKVNESVNEDVGSSRYKTPRGFKSVGKYTELLGADDIKINVGSIKSPKYVKADIYQKRDGYVVLTYSGNKTKKVSNDNLNNVFVNESVNELVNEENTRFNKWLLKFIDNYMKGSEKPGTPEYQWIIKTLFQHTLYDANFHSEAKKVEKIFRRAKEPNKAEQLDGLLLNKAEDIAAKAKWDGYDIIDGFAYVSAMRIGGPKLDPIKALKNESVNEAKQLQREGKFKKEDLVKITGGQYNGKSGLIISNDLIRGMNIVQFADGSLKGIKPNNLTKESVVNENFSKEDIEKLRDVVLDAKGAQNIGKELKKAGFKYDFSTEPIPLYMIKKGSKKFVLVNKRYADNPDFVVYGIAGGLLGS